MHKWERIYSQGPRVSNNQLIGFWKLIQLFLKHHVVLQNTHQNCNTVFGLCSKLLKLHWIGLIVFLMDSWTPKKTAEIWENLKTFINCWISWLDLVDFLSLIAFPETINIEELQRPQLILCLEYVEDISIGDGLQEKAWFGGQSWPVTILEFWVFRNFQGMINFKQMYWSGEFGGFNQLHCNFTVAIHVHYSQLTDGRSLKTYEHQRTLLNLFPWKVSPLSVRTLW